MKSPQSPHSSSLWVFALSLRVLFRTLPISALKSLGYYTSSTVLLFVGLRVISLGVGRWDSRCFGFVGNGVHCFGNAIGGSGRPGMGSGLVRECSGGVWTASRHEQVWLGWGGMSRSWHGPMAFCILCGYWPPSLSHSYWPTCLGFITWGLWCFQVTYLATYQ